MMITLQDTDITQHTCTRIILDILLRARERMSGQGRNESEGRVKGRVKGGGRVRGNEGE